MAELQHHEFAIARDDDGYITEMSDGENHEARIKYPLRDQGSFDALAAEVECSCGERWTHGGGMDWQGDAGRAEIAATFNAHLSYVRRKPLETI